MARLLLRVWTAMGNNRTKERLGEWVAPVFMVWALCACGQAESADRDAQGTPPDGATADAAVANTDAAPQAQCLVQASAGGHHTCVRKADGSIWCWGANNTAQLNNDSDEHSPSPAKLDIDDSVELVAGGQHTCVIKDDSSLWCWGWNASGQIGKGINTATSLAFEVFESGVQQVESSPSGRHTCARHSDGAVWCWGDNDHGQVGSGLDEDAWSPVKVIQAPNATPTLGGNFTCLAEDQNEGWCWGANHFGQQGIPQPGSREPAPANLAPFVTTTAGGTTMCGIKADRSLWCWGMNMHGQLGDGTIFDSVDPVQTFAAGVVDAQMAGNFGCAIKDDSSLWCWGKNDYGQLGDGTTEQRLTPVLTIESDVVAVTTGISHACAVKSDESLWCWGLNRYGQLGIGTFPAQPHQPNPDPMQVDTGCAEKVSFGSSTH